MKPKSIFQFSFCLVGVVIVTQMAKRAAPGHYLVQDVGIAVTDYRPETKVALKNDTLIPAITKVRDAYVNRNGMMLELRTSYGEENAFHFHVSDAGKIAGSLHITDSYTHAFLWDGGDRYRDIGTLGGPSSYAYCLNNEGDVVGYSETRSKRLHAFLYHRGVMQDLGTLGGPSSYANGVNDNGKVVGDSQIHGGQTHAFLYSEGVMWDMGTLGGQESLAYGINNQGEIVGASSTMYDHFMHAFLWRKGKMIDLNRFLPMRSGWVLREARGIDADGKILGIGEYRGVTRAFLLTPRASTHPHQQ